MRTDAELMAVVRSPEIQTVQLDWLMLFGFLAAFASIFFFFFQRRSRASMFAFALSVAVGGVYGILSGVWPLALVQFVFAGNRFIYAFKMSGGLRVDAMPGYYVPLSGSKSLLRPSVSESRLKRLFGSI